MAGFEPKLSEASRPADLVSLANIQPSSSSSARPAPTLWSFNVEEFDVERVARPTRDEVAEFQRITRSS